MSTTVACVPLCICPNLPTLIYHELTRNVCDYSQHICFQPVCSQEWLQASIQFSLYVIFEDFPQLKRLVCGIGIFVELSPGQSNLFILKAQKTLSGQVICVNGRVH